VRVVAAGAALAAVGVLGYGWWGAHTRADVWLRVNDHAGRTPNQLWSNLKEAQVAIGDAGGQLLAEATLEPPQGLPRWTGPADVAVHCAPELGREVWRRCWERQSRWMAFWAPRAHAARVTVGRCAVDRVPVVRREYSDWWLWWLPLPHSGGSTISNYTIELHLDSARCAPAQPPTDP
jgi:hypothetical protein